MCKIVVLPDDGRKARHKVQGKDHGHLGTGSSRGRPTAEVFTTFFGAHTGQAATYSWVSLLREGHQNRCCKN